MPDGTDHQFDEVILACHADQSLRLISSPTDEERNLLKSFPYQDNRVTLHSDDSVIPDENLLGQVGMLTYQGKKVMMPLLHMI